jgi:NADPH:quinone reductase-like Zn-dependent oxidoreductase
MKAIRIHGRGGPDHLVYEDAPRPHPGPRLSCVWWTNGPLNSAPHAFPETLNGKDASGRT